MRRPLGLSESQRHCETDQRLSRIIRNILASASLQPSSYLEATSDRITILEFDTEWSRGDIIVQWQEQLHDLSRTMDVIKCDNYS